MNEKLKVLHLEDVSSDAILVNNKLKKSKLDYILLLVDTKDKFINELINFSPDIILADHSLPSFNSQEALIILKKSGLKIPFIVVTATMSDEFAAGMIVRGADDYILKDRLNRLPTAIHDALEKYRLQHQKEVIVAELIKSETRLKQTQAIAHIGSWELDYATDVAIWSEEQLKIYGLEPENNRHSFQKWVSFIHPEDVDYVLQKTNDAKSALSNADYFHRIIRQDRTVRHLYSQIRVRVNSSGKPTGLHGVTRDVTEARKRENALQESQLNLQSIFENTSDGFILADSKGIIKTFNDKARDRTLLNINREIAIGKSYLDFLPYSRKKIIKDNISTVLAGKIVQYDHAYTRKNGETKWFSFTINPVYTDEKIEGFSITTTDITERKKGEQQLKLLESVITNTTDAVVITEAEPFDEPGPKIVYVNEAFTRMTGYSADEVIGKTPRVLQGPKSDRNELARLAKALRNWESCEVTIVNYKKNGDEFWNNFSISPVANEKGWFTHWISIERDVTQRKNEQQERNILQTTLQNSLNEIYIFDVDTFEFIYVNKGALLNLGYSESEIKAITPLDLKPDITAASFDQLIIPLVIGEKEKIVFFTNHKRKDGSLYPVEIHLQLITEGNNKRFLAIVLDITERKISEEKVKKLNEAIAKSEKFFKGVIESSDDMITVIGPEGKTIYASPAVSKKFGYTHEECLNINLADIVHPDDVLIMQEFIMKIMTHPGTPMECPLIRDRKKDGTYMWVEGTLTNFVATEGINAIVANFRDVTERKRSADEIRFKANLLNTIGQAAVATDMNGVVNYWNNAAEKIYGWTQEEALGKNIKDLTPSQATKEQNLEITEELKQGHQWSGEFRVQRKNGTDFPAWVTDAPIYDEQQNLAGMIAISSDITAQKKLQELLDKTNKLARIGNYELNVEDTTVYWSEVTREIHEVDKDFVPDVAKAMSFYQEASSKEIITNALNDLREKSIPFDVEVQIITAKGNKRWVRLTGQAESVEGKCIKRYGSFQDINARKMAEIEVLKVFEEKNIILESIGDGFFAVDKNWVVTYWNKKAAIMLHTPKNKIIDRSLWEVFTDRIDSQSYRKYQKAIKTKRVIRFEDYFLILDKWFDISAYPSNNGLSVFFKDITHQKTSEKEREKITANLVQRNVDLEQFSYIVSHNMRSPVADIIGLCNVLQKDNLTDIVKSKIISGLASSVNMLDVVFKDLNNILKVRAGINEIKQDVCFSKLVNNIILSIGSIIEKEKAIILPDFSAVDEMVTIKTYLHSIFYNLITNSLKYRQADISPVIKISSQKLKGKIVLFFNDNGIGIDLKKNSNQVFGLYKRFHSNLAEGKGMGLYMVKTQVESIGGKISITSEVNKGTTFKIEFET